MCGRGGKANRIQHRAASNDQHERLPANACAVNGLDHRLEDPTIILRRLPARYDQDLGRKSHAVTVRAHVPCDPPRQTRPCASHALVETNQQAVGAVGRLAQHVRQHMVGGVEHVAGETKPVDKRHAECRIVHNIGCDLALGPGVV